MGVLLLVRHGQASFGSPDYDQLSQVGRRQADLIARRLAGAPTGIGRLVSGALVRQRDTAQAIGGACRVPVEVDHRWDEYDHVDITADRSASLMFDPLDPGGKGDRAAATLDEALRRWVAGGVSGTESHRCFVDRCMAALRSLTAGAGTVVVATSGGVIAVICASLLGLPMKQWPTLSHVEVNTGITKVVTGRQGLSLVSFNDHAHLEHDRELITYR